MSDVSASEQSADADPRPGRRVQVDALPRAILSLTSGTAAAAIVFAGLRWRLGDFAGIRWGQCVWAAKNAFYDIALLASIATLCLVFAFVLRHRWEPTRAIVGAFFTFCIVAIVVCAINISAVSLIGGPLTFQWLYYADFLATFTSQSAVESALNASFFLNIAGGLVAFAVLTFASRPLLLLTQRCSPFAPLGLAALVLALYFWASSDRRTFLGEDRSQVVSPLIELVRTAATAGTSGLESEPHPILPAKLPLAIHDPADLPERLAKAKVRNVLIIVMESVGADSVAGFGPPQAYQWTPNLARYEDKAFRFTRAYAHVPYSSKSLYALLSAQYPLFTYKLETDQFDGMPIPTLSDVLHRKGYRTGFFMSGELAFQRVDRFLGQHSFDTAADMTTLGCKGQRYIGSTPDWPNMDSVDDECTAAAVSSWIDHRAGRPFLGVFWTGNTHWPYFSQRVPQPGLYSLDERRNRYLGALRDSDQAIGKLLDHLDRTGVLSHTLVVVLGDHGEAFGQHGYRAHGNSIFEEEVHIPLLLINGSIAGARVDTLGGISDIAPTVLHILGMDPPADWSGRSLFSPRRAQSVFMFSINQDMMIGFREGDGKYIYETARDRSLVFNLRDDPRETRDVGTASQRETVRRRAAGWLLEQKLATQRLLAAGRH